MPPPTRPQSGVTGRRKGPLGGVQTDNFTWTVVYLKREWDEGEWVEAPYLRPVKADRSLAPERSTAQFVLNYGKIRHWDDTFYHQVGKMSIVDHYVAIVAYPSPNSAQSAGHCIWAGVIPAETVTVHGSGNPTGASPNLREAGVQNIQAYGFEYLLQRRFMRNSFSQKPGDRADTNPVGREFTFNTKMQTGFVLRGNRTQDTYDFGLVEYGEDVLYGFGGDKKWTYLDILHYLLFFSGARTGEPDFEFEPNFRLDLPGASPPPGGGSPSGASIEQWLDTHVDVVRQRGRSVWKIMNELLNRRRALTFGISWDIDVFTALPDNTQLKVQVYSTTDIELTRAGITLPANNLTTTLRLDDDRDIISAVVTNTSLRSVDQYRIIGRRTVSCFSAATYDPNAQDFDPNLAKEKNLAQFVKGWSGSIQISYEAEEDPKIRKRSVYDHVFRRFVLGDTNEHFDWITKGEPNDRQFLHPGYDADGFIDPRTNSNFTNLPRRILRSLPFDEDGTLAFPSRDQQQRGQPLAFMRVVDDDGAFDPLTRDEWFVAHDLPEDYVTEGGNAQIVPSSLDMALFVKFAAPETLAAGNELLSSPEWDVSPLWNYNQMVITVAVETDNPPEIRVDVPYTAPPAATSLGQSMSRRTKIVHIPTVEVWIVTPSTVLSIGYNEALDIFFLHRANAQVPTSGPYGARTVRDDTDKLRLIALAIQSYVAVPRSSVAITRKGIMPDIPLGTFIDAVQYGQLANVRTIVTKETWDFDEHVRSITTDHLEIDFEVA